LSPCLKEMANQFVERSKSGRHAGAIVSVHPFMPIG
jgi:hypothetical protein